MFSAVLGWLSGPIIGAIFKPITEIAQAYINKEISEVEAKARMVQSLTQGVAQVEVAHADAIKSTYGSFMDAAKSSAMMKAVWSTVVITQLFVLLWHQVGIPAVVFFTDLDYPSSGSTVEWAYALIGALMGLGPMVFRTGPGASGGGWIDTIKNMIGKR